MPAKTNPSQYLMPSLESSNDTKLGWLKEAKQDGDSFLQNQRAWRDIDLGVDIISGDSYPRSVKGMSDLRIPMLKRDTREAVSTLANMRPIWGYKVDNEQLQQQNTVLNKMLRAWYFRPFVRDSFRSSLQYAAACGLGWVSPVWGTDSVMKGMGIRDIFLEVYGPRDIVPYGMGRDNDIQKCYVVTIRKEVPLQLAMMDYPTMTDILVPSRGTASWMKKGSSKVRRFLSPLLQAIGPGSGKENEDTNPFPTVDIFFSYILDASINTTDRPIPMGEGSWQYIVPVLGSDIPTGIKDSSGRDLVRKATEEDSRIYPLRRRTVWTENGIIGDGSSPYWHGMVPAVPFTIDQWPWDFIGYSMPHDGASIEKAASRILRNMDDSFNAKLDSPLAYDDQSLSGTLMERINPLRRGQRIKINMQQNDNPIKPLIPAEYYQVDPAAVGLPDKLFEAMHYVLGTRDIAALAKAKQVPSGDSMEKLMELAGPIITDMSMKMETSMVRLGEMWKGDAFQFYNFRHRVQVLGKEGVTDEDFDYDPANMIPSHLPDEMEKNREHANLAAKSGLPYTPPESRASIVERSRAHLSSFYFHVTPSSLHQITQLTKKLLYLQLWKGQFPIDPWSVAEAMDIDNFGDPAQLKKILNLTDVPSDKMGRWIMWRELLAKFAPQPGHVGRKPSHGTPPAIQSKDGGTRTTERTSPR